MRNLTIALAAATLANLSMAENRFVLIVPIVNPAQLQDQISIELLSSALPATKTRQSYQVDLKPYAKIRGERLPDPSKIHWELSAGALPQGLALDERTGLLQGVAERFAFDPFTFSVKAGYKDATAVANYSLQINGHKFLSRKLKYGDNTGCAMANTGKLNCWGHNTYGELGVDSFENISAATEVKAYPDEITDFMTGWYHNCVLTTSGAVKCWGRNNGGQLGIPIDPSVPGYNVAIQINGFSGPVRSLNAGNMHSCALMQDSTVECWGSNSYGQLGDGTFVASSVPVRVKGLTDAVEVIAGEFQSCALKSDGALWCWGNNSNGQLGYPPSGSVGVKRASAAVVPGLETGVASFDTGWKSVCVVTTAGEAKCLGQNNTAQLGDGSKVDRYAPTPVHGLLAGVARIHLGQTHTCAVMLNGAISCWGDNSHGQAGQVGVAEVLTPASVAIPFNVRTVALGWRSSCVELTSDEMMCWGRNDLGQLGDGTFDNSAEPRPLFAN